MRPLEILLLAADVLAFVVLLLPRAVGAAPRRFVAPACTLAVLVQVFVEGSRWQLVPAYAIVGVLAVLSLAPRGPSRRVVVLGSAALGVIALAAAIALPVLFPVFRVPRPTGPDAIGTVTYHWIDRARPEMFTAAPDDRRELIVQFWYPARAVSSAPAPYVDDADALAPLARLLRLPTFVFGHLEYVSTNAIPSAPIAGSDGARYPVLIFLHGRGGFRQQNTRLVEELASRGFVVAAIDQPYVACGVVFPDGRLVALDPRMLDRRFVDGRLPFLVGDVSFTLDRLRALDEADSRGILTGHLDLARAGVLGVSLGGEITAEACRREPRLTACLAMDVWMPPAVVASGLEQPTMWITRDARSMALEGWPPAVIEETLGTIRATFDRLRADGYLVLVPGTFHQDFSDAPLLSPLTSALGVTGPIDGDRAHRIISAYTVAFFDRHLRGRPAPLLDRSGPGAIVERRRP